MLYSHHQHCLDYFRQQGCPSGPGPDPTLKPGGFATRDLYVNRVQRMTRLRNAGTTIRGRGLTILFPEVIRLCIGVHITSQYHQTALLSGITTAFSLVAKSRSSRTNVRRTKFIPQWSMLFPQLMVLFRKKIVVCLSSPRGGDLPLIVLITSTESR